MTRSIIIAKALLFSTGLVVGSIGFFYWRTGEWITPTFFACIAWPIIFGYAVLWHRRDDLGYVDQIKIQNFYNLDAMRRNSDREAQEFSWRKRN